MFDLALTPKGDIIFTQNKNRTKPLTISFGITKTNLLKLSFEVTDCYPIETSQNGIRISFEIDELKNNKKAMLFYNDDALKQAIKIRLLTAIGELPNRTAIGSKLELVKHKPLHDVETKTLLTDYVKQALVSIIPNVDVRVEPNIDKLNGYSQGMNIYIYNNGFLVFKYNLKG